MRIAALSVFLLLVAAPTAAAHTTADLSEYGKPTVNGAIGPAEYGNGCAFGNESAAGISYPITVCEQNDEQNDYYAVKIGDLTNDAGDLSDSVLLWFDNNHDGIVQAAGGGCPYGQPNEDKIGWYFNFFWDGYYCIDGGTMTFGLDLTINGTAQRVFTPGQGWTFEFSHPLDTADPDDYSLALHDTVGWCLTYDDKSNPLDNTAVGEIQFPPGCFIDKTDLVGGLAQGDATLLADVFKETVFDELLEKIKNKLKQYVAGCKFCPPDPRQKLLAKINEVVKAAKKERKAKTLRGLKQLKGIAQDLPGGKGKGKLLKEIRSQIRLVKGSKKAKSRPNSAIPGGVHAGQTMVRPTGIR